MRSILRIAGGTCFRTALGLLMVEAAAGAGALEREGPPASGEEGRLAAVAPQASSDAANAGAGSAGAPPPAAAALRIDIQAAILMAMQNNRSLAVERLSPGITRTVEEEERAVFDWVAGAEVAPRQTVSDRLSRAGSGIESSTVDGLSGSLTLDRLLPTGTDLGLSATTTYTDSSLYSDTFTSNRLGLTVTQALLQGRDLRANTARIEQARIDTQISEYELRGFAERLVEEVEVTFWDYALAQRQIGILEESLSVAERQRVETEERIKLGSLAETELAAAQAEVALRQENLINAKTALAKEHLALLRLLNPAPAIDWSATIELEYQTVLPSVVLDGVERHVEVALRMRPEVNQAELELERGELELVRTRNGLLPVLDIFIDFGKSGYADSFGPATEDLEGGSYDVTAGLRAEYPVGNRAARARHERAVLGQEQTALALANLRQLVEVDVRFAYIEVERFRAQITATSATRSFQEEKLRAETEKFRVGRSTSLLVAAAQRDLVASQIAETQAVANYVKALVVLYRMEGSLLDRRGIATPGGGQG